MDLLSRQRDVIIKKEEDLDNESEEGEEGEEVDEGESPIEEETDEAEDEIEENTEAEGQTRNSPPVINIQINTCDSETTEMFDYGKMIRDKRFYYFLIVVVLVAVAGSYLIYESMKTEFYDTLEKPSWAPPSSSISLIWTILYFIISVATYRAYLYGNSDQRKTLLWIFGIQLALNFLWSYVFFYLKNPRAARIIILLLLCMIVIQGSYMHSLEKTSGYLFIPYFLWVSFASYLNFEIVRLNEL